MPTLSDTATSTELALAFQPTGFEEIPGATILTRLNYYDGKFLRADDLQLEQNYLRRLAELGARAGGAGLVYGFDVLLGSGDALTIGGGLGFDPAGRALYLPGSFSTTLQALVDATARTSAEAFALSEGASGFAVCTGSDATTPTPTSNGGAEYYLITIAHAEEACGDEEVFGKLCDDGCATSTDRAYIIEGVVVRARPYRPATPFATSKVVQLAEKHLRSLLVSAAYADEKLAVPSLISKAGLLSGPWCTGAAAPSGWEVPIAVVGVLSSSRFVDEWVVRRERMDTPPRRYWAWTMAMRPWEAYLAQILQFQCQLPSALTGQGGGPTATDPCADQRAALGEAVRYIGQLRVAVEQQPADVAVAAKDVATPVETTLSTNPSVFLTELGGISKLQDLQLRLTDIYRRVSTPSSRILVDGGIVELPPAGYLPVTPGSTTPVDEQVRRLMGDGVDLRFCVTTPDYIPHALEKAQHMDRISLIQGLDNPATKPPVDVLIPGGVIGTAVAATGWDVRVVMRSFLLGLARSVSSSAAADTAVAAPAAAPSSAPAAAAPGAAAPPPAPAPPPSMISSVGITRVPTLSFQGMGRTAPTATGAEIAIAAPGTVSSSSDATASPALSGYAGASVDVDPFTLAVGGIFNVTGEAALAVVAAAATNDGAEQMQATGSARLAVVSPSQQTANGRVLTATGTLHATGSVSGATSDSGTTSIDILVKVEETSTNPPTYAVTVTKAGATDGGGVLLSATWSGTPLTVDAFADNIDTSTGTGTTGTAVNSLNELSDVSFVSSKAATTAATHLIAAELVEDSDVFSASNPRNVAAHQALQTLADALGDTRFTGPIADALFDPTAQGGQASGITATQDWVLFHRRRHKDCQKVQAAPPVVSKTYGVFVANTKTAAALKRALTALAADDRAVVTKMFEPAGTVTFAGGTASLTTAQSTILAAWNATKPSARIAAGVIATDESDETVSLLQSRIVAYQTAVSSVSTPNPNEPLTNRTTLSSLPSGGVDGQIVLVTTVAPTICHHVYVAPQDGNAAGTIFELQKTLGIDTFLTRYAKELTDLGTIVFDDLTASVESSTLTALLAAGFQSAVGAYMVVPEAGTSSAEPLTEQAKAVLTAVQADASHATIETVAAGANVQTWPSDCPIVSVFVAPVNIN